MMNWIAFGFAIVGTGIALVHRTMVSRIYDADGKALSTFALPRAIRREYRARFGRDTLFWISLLLPFLFIALVAVGLTLVLMKRT